MRPSSLVVALLLSACTAAADPSGAPPSADSHPGAAAAPSPAPAGGATLLAAPVGAETTPLVPAPGAHAHIEDEQNTIDVFRAAAPATVFVTQNQEVVDYWNRRTVEVPAGSGSGFVWDKQGHIVTNFHVVDGGRSYTVTLQDQSVWPATLVGGDPHKDVAVLKIEASADKLVPIRLPPEGDTTTEVGQKALAIGNPFGLDHTLTTGVISAMDREIVGYGDVTIRGMIQTDASINPGNSGGPLLDSAGQLIGMNSMIYSKSGSSAGIGFAVPVSTVRHVVVQLIEKGHVEQVGIGVRILDARSAQRFGITGVAILEATTGSPAQAAGLRGFTRTRSGYLLGDVIVAIDGTKVDDYDDLYNALDGRHPGEQVTVTILRDRAQQEVKVPLVAITDGG